MNLLLMRQRSECCKLIEEMKLSFELTKTSAEPILLQCLNILKESGSTEAVSSLAEAVQGECFQSPDTMRYSIDLFAAGVLPRDFAALLEQAKMKQLMEYPKADVKAVLLDHEIPMKYCYIYLKYYKGKGMSSEEKERLWRGLDLFFLKSSHGEDWIAENGCVLSERIFAGGFLSEVKHYDECVEQMISDENFKTVMEHIRGLASDAPYVDDENIKELTRNSVEIDAMLTALGSRFNEKQWRSFCALWLENHALLRDLRYLKKKLAEIPETDVETILAGRTAYIAFCYNECFPKKLDPIREKQVIYAITHKKHAFLRLVRDHLAEYQKIPKSSLLFYREFYTDCVNLNTLNARNLKECTGMPVWKQENLRPLLEKERTFDEVALLYGYPMEYVQLYDKISARRKMDDAMRIMKELIKRDCLDGSVLLDEAAEMLAHKPLSRWMQQEFSHIQGLDEKTALWMLGVYGKLKSLVPQIQTVAEVKYIAGQPELLSGAHTMQEIRRDVVYRNPEWKELECQLGFTEEFVRDNEGRIREFILQNGAHMTSLYLKDNSDRKEEIRRLVAAELIGKFNDLKYHDGDLEQEIDFSLTKSQKKTWMENYREEDGGIVVWEADGFLPTLQMGETPVHTCLSYASGIYSRCLIANFDSNKKVIYLSMGGNTVLRAALRLTKGGYQENGKRAKLEFADLLADEKEMPEHQPRYGEQLVLFLERAYISGLSEKMYGQVFSVLLQMVRRKARELGALLLISNSYRNWLREEFVSIHFSMYISSSKAGAQYLDSLGGENRVDEEGSYDRKCFLFDPKSGKLA